MRHIDFPLESLLPSRFQLWLVERLKIYLAVTIGITFVVVGGSFLLQIFGL